MIKEIWLGKSISDSSRRKYLTLTTAIVSSLVTGTVIPLIIFGPEILLQFTIQKRRKNQRSQEIGMLGYPITNK